MDDMVDGQTGVFEQKIPTGSRATFCQLNIPVLGFTLSHSRSTHVNLSTEMDSNILVEFENHELSSKIPDHSLVRTNDTPFASLSASLSFLVYLAESE